MKVLFFMQGKMKTIFEGFGKNLLIFVLIKMVTSILIDETFLAISFKILLVPRVYVEELNFEDYIPYFCLSH